MHFSLNQALGRQPRLNRVGQSLLSIGSGAFAAYSLRSLTGGDPKAVKVRRTIGGEQDFTVSGINSGELASFCSEDGFLFSSSSGAFGFTFPQGDESGTYLETSTDTTYTKNEYWKFTKEFTGTWVLNYEDGTNLYRIDSGDGSTVHPKDVDWTGGTVTSTPTDFHGSYYGNDYNFLSDTGYYSFTTGSDGFVSIWYDQSGNGNNASQAFTSRQTKIVNSGTLLEDANGNPYLQFDGTNDFYNADKTVFNNVSYGYISTVAQYDDANAANKPVYFASIGTSGTSTRVGLGKFNISGAKFAASGRRLDADAFRSSTETADTNKNLLTGLYQWADGDVQLVLNGAAKTAASYSSGAGSTSATDSNSAFIGRLGSSYYDGNLYELIIYNTDQSGKREALETNIADEYGITLS